MTIQEMINVPIREYYTLMRRYTKRDQGNYKKMSVFSHDHLIISSSEGLHYLDMKNPDKDPLMVNATEMIKKLDKTRYFKEIKNFAVSQIPFSQRHLMRIMYKSTKANKEGIVEEDKNLSVVLASFMNPATRAQDILGDIGQFVDDAVFVSDNLILVNFMTVESFNFFQDQYWTLLDSRNGQIMRLDKRIKTLNDRLFKYQAYFDIKVQTTEEGELEKFKCLVFRKGKKKQEEKQITFVKKSGKIKVLDASERLREIQKEEQFALLLLNDKAEKKKELVFNSKALLNQLKSLVKQDKERDFGEKDARVNEVVQSLDLSSNIKVSENGKIYRMASFVDPYASTSKRIDSKPQLLGCCEFSHENYQQTINALIFRCQTSEQQRQF